MKRVMGAAVALVISTQPVLLHDWYPLNCCSGQDCAPAIVLRIEASTLTPSNSPLGPMIVTNKFGTVLVPDTFKRQRSPDGQWHACISDSYDFMSGKMQPRLICLFEPDPV